VAKSAVLFEQRLPARSRDFVWYGTQPEKCARCSRPLFRDHVLIPLLHALLAARLALLVAGNDCDTCDAPYEQCGAN
jgi:hypothetical protein